MSDKKRLNLCGIYLKKFRETQNLTLTDIQAVLEIDYGIHLDRTNLGRIESGSRTVSDIELVVLANLLHVSIEQLLWGAEDKEIDVKDFINKEVQVSNVKRRGSSTKDT